MTGTDWGAGSGQPCTNIQTGPLSGGGSGSLQDQSLKEVWNSDNYKNLRSRIDNAEKEPDTDYICAKPPKMDKGAG
jgi:hypothetical protein